MIYDELSGDHASRKIPMVPLGRTEALQVFAQWKTKDDKIAY
jgi:hypothetical protein